MLSYAVPPDDSTMCAPEFVDKLSDLTVKDGEPLLLKCNVTGDPDPQVEWYKNGEVGFDIKLCYLTCLKTLSKFIN